jgi:hypothetical protein
MAVGAIAAAVLVAAGMAVGAIGAVVFVGAGIAVGAAVGVAAGAQAAKTRVATSIRLITNHNPYFLDINFSP